MAEPQLKLNSATEDVPYAEEKEETRSFPSKASSYAGVFFRNWLLDPLNVAAIAPSSRFLGKIMATGLHEGARVLELGGGTGTFTQAILARGVRPQDLYVVEQNSDFVAVLKHRFPGIHVVQCDAATLRERLGHLAGTFDYAVSGLPLLWFSREKKTQILEGSFALLKPEGRFHQVTYLGRSPVGGRILSSLRLKASLIGITPINIPPAFVYCFNSAAV